MEPFRNHLLHCSNLNQIFFFFLLFFYYSCYLYLLFNCWFPKLLLLFLLQLLFLLFLYFCFCHPGFVCFVFHYFSHSSGYLVIFTSSVFQLISELQHAKHGIPNIMLHFCQDRGQWALFYFPFFILFDFIISFLFLFLFLEQLRLGFISHAVTSVTN